MNSVLTEQQIKHISKLIEYKGVNYIDVNQELTDHIATEVEDFIRQHPKVDYMTAVKTVFLKYGRFYFMKIEEEKEKQIEKQSLKEYFSELISFFTIPKVIFTILLFITYHYFISFPTFFKNISVVIAILSIIAIISLVIYKKKVIGKGMYIQLKIYYSVNFILSIVINPSLLNMIIKPEYTTDVNTTSTFLRVLFLTTMTILTLAYFELTYKKITQLKDKYKPVKSQ